MRNFLPWRRIALSLGLLVPVWAVLALAAPAERPTDVVEAAVTRTYYIAADEVDWDYAPLGYNKITGGPFDAEAQVFVKRGPIRIGRVYRKSLYREYTDASFTQLKPRSAEWQHLGALGPVIRAEVGNSVVVVFKNNTGIPASIHVHGLLYDKASEGAAYNDGTMGTLKSDDGVPPGGTYTYRYQVPERAGPGPGDPSSTVWMYHSHVDEVKDTNSGLIGAIIVTARGAARADGSPKDVDREFVTLFTVWDENQSWHLAHNIQTFAQDPGAVKPDDEEFQESNLMHSINGYVFGNLPGLTMHKGERVRWYVLSLGTEVDLHTPHWHGETLLLGGPTMGMRTDMTELLPGSMKVLDMVPDAPGQWLFHCHVNDHISAGMLAQFLVQP